MLISEMEVNQSRASRFLLFSVCAKLRRQAAGCGLIYCADMSVGHQSLGSKRVNVFIEMQNYVFMVRLVAALNGKKY